VDFPTANALDPTGDAYMDGFVTKFDPAGNSLIFSTYLGGRAAREYAYNLATDTNGNVYVCGMTESSDYPTMNAYQTTHAGEWDGFVTKLNTHGTPMEFSTFLGGSRHDSSNALVIDPAGYTYIVGSTNSSDFPTRNAFQGKHGGGGFDSFLAKLDPTGANAVYCTFLGGSSGDFSYGVGVDVYGNAYISGETQSFNFPTYKAFQPDYGGNWDGFIARFTNLGTSLEYSTFLGGGQRDQTTSVTVDRVSDVYITGYTESANFPTLNAFQKLHATSGGTRDGFVTKMSTSTSIPVLTFTGAIMFIVVLSGIICSVSVYW
jgi:hypothetical protein